MRTVMKLLACAAAATTFAVVSATPALADPPSGTTPKNADVVGVGAQTSEFVFDQFSTDYNKTLAATKPHLYAFDATNPTTGATGDSIVTKLKCKAVARPNGSNAGIKLLTTDDPTVSSHPCVDFATSSRSRATTDPTNISFIQFAGDAVSYATQSSTNAPANLSQQQLQEIYSCEATKWNQVGGTSKATIQPFAPQSGSGTASFWLQALGLTAFGSCVSTSATQSGAAGASANTLEQNEGVAAILVGNKNAIVPFDVGDFLSQAYHSAACENAGCTPDSSGKICVPTGSDNTYGCDVNGTLKLNEVAGTKPTTIWPLTKSSKGALINSKFDAQFLRDLYVVVKDAEGSIPAGEYTTLFGPRGWICGNSTAHKDLKDYGFLVLPSAGTGAVTSADCGFAS